MSISPDAIAHARSINLIEFLIARGHKPVSRRPHHADFHAPYREDRNPSFSVSQRPDGTWVWYDFGRNEHEGCKHHGDLIDLVQLLDHVPFAEALHRILHNTVRSMAAPSEPSTAPPTDKERIAHAKKLYYAAQANMTPEREEELRSYFHKLALPYNQHLGAVWMRLGDDGIPYVAFPLPTPNIHFMQGLMARALGEAPPALMRVARGLKGPWILKRGNAPILITESIVDCLAGDELFGPSFTLCALNGLNTVERLQEYLKRLPSRIIYVALDNDASCIAVGNAPQNSSRKKGPHVQKELVSLLTHMGYHVMEVLLHHNANVKDLHKLWLKHPQRVSLLDLAKTGLHHAPAC